MIKVYDDMINIKIYVVIFASYVHVAPDMSQMQMGVKIVFYINLSVH